MKNQASWEEEAIQVVGEVISFWGFKENHGKIWALLYIKKQQLSTSEIRAKLLLSKGAASMLLQDLEKWKVIQRIDNNNERERYFSANDNLLEMIVNIIQEREEGIIKDSLHKLIEIEKRAKHSNAEFDEIQRLQHMQEFAIFMKKILSFSSLLQNSSLSQATARLEIISKVIL
jgi:HTH-type transcriptional regulator, glycine betaine synthesis regulator